MFDYLLKTIKLDQNLVTDETLDQSSDKGRSLLHMAAAAGNERIIFELAGDEDGCCKKCLETNGCTAFHVTTGKKGGDLYDIYRLTHQNGKSYHSDESPCK